MDNKQLEVLADTVDKVLNGRKIAGRVTGGVVKPRSIVFEVNAELKAGNGLEAELARELSVPEVMICGQAITIKRLDAQPVKLPALLTHLRNGAFPMPPFTAVLGRCDDGAPLLLRLPSPTVGHVLVTGPDGCGKTSLLRTIATSLGAMNSRQSLKLIVSGDDLGDLAKLPHILRCPVSSLSGRLDAILVTHSPRVVVVMDDLADILPVAKILSDGHKAGVHLVASGNVSSSGFGVLISGRGEPGDFDAMACGQKLNFQSAFVDAGEVGNAARG